MRLIAVNGQDQSGRPLKWAEFATREDADAFLATNPDAFMVDDIGGNPTHWRQTESGFVIDPRPAPRSSVLSYAAFEARFTEAEQDAMADFVYAADPATGLPLRKGLLKAYNRSVASGLVNLDAPETGAFMDALVAGGVLGADTNPKTNARRAEILA